MNNREIIARLLRSYGSRSRSVVSGTIDPDQCEVVKDQVILRSESGAELDRITLNRDEAGEVIGAYTPHRMGLDGFIGGQP